MIIHVEADGGIHLPKAVVRQIGAVEGGLLECTLEGNTIRLTAPPDIVRETQTPSVSLNCFGRLTIEQAGRYIYLPCSKARELIALLLAEKGRPLRKEWVASILWPKSKTTMALDSLYKAMRRVNELSRGGLSIPIHVRRNEIWIDVGSISADVLLFEKLCKKGGLPELERAAALYRAPFLSEEYFSWAATTQSYYDMLFVEAAHQIITYYKQNGSMEKVRYYRRLLANRA